jgi:hypothetical protein
MKATYKCEEGHVKAVTFGIKEGAPEDVICDECNAPMKRVFTNINVEVPEWFGDDEFTDIKSRMNESLLTGQDHLVY